MSEPTCNHAAGFCVDVDERGHLPAVFGDQPEGRIPSMTAAETLDPREAISTASCPVKTKR